MNHVVLAWGVMIVATLAPPRAVAQTSSQPGGVERAPTQAAPPAVLRSVPVAPTTTLRNPPAPLAPAPQAAPATVAPPAGAMPATPAPELKANQAPPIQK